MLDDWTSLTHALAVDTDARAWNTAAYLFHHMRCGIACRVQGSRLAAFLPFYNPGYRNNWPEPIFNEGSLDAFLAAHAQATRDAPEKVMRDTREWWANGSLVCNVRMPWGSSMLPELRAAAEAAAASMPDCVFFMNKRDHPVLRRDGREAYSAPFRGAPPSIFQPTNAWMQHARDVDPATATVADVFAPIFSFYTSDAFADAHMPLVHDYNLSVPRGPRWRDRREEAIFRGGATGSVDHNPRLILASMSGIDAKLTSWNLRHKFDEKGVMRFVDPQQHPFDASRSYHVPMDRQTRWKYLIYASGHVGADRLSRQLVSGSVVFLLESSLPQPWIYYRLNPWQHYIPVAADASDLHARIAWARAHDRECEAMARRAQAFVLDQIASFCDAWGTAQTRSASGAQAWRHDQLFRNLPDAFRSRALLDATARFSVTPDAMARRIANICCAPIGGRRPDSVLDAFACVGGDTIALAEHFRRVTACELSRARKAMLDNNLSTYRAYVNGRIGRVRTVLGDVNTLSLPRHDVVFFDPPWGGTDYKQQDSMRITVGGHTMRAMVERALQQSHRVVVKLPMNYDITEFENMSSRCIALRRKMRVLVFEVPAWGIVIPYRAGRNQEERAQQLATIVPHLKNMFAGTGMHLLVCEQSDDGKLFNRGAVLNAAVRLLSDQVPNLSHVVLHDVDLLPNEHLKSIYAACPEPGTVVHPASVWERYNDDPKFLGGVTIVRVDDFFRVGGFCNDICGWGGEDEVLAHRLRAAGVTVRKITDPACAFEDLERMDLPTKLQWLRDRKQKCMTKREQVRAHRVDLKRRRYTNDVENLRFRIMRRISSHHVLIDFDSRRVRSRK